MTLPRSEQTIDEIRLELIDQDDEDRLRELLIQAQNLVDPAN